MNVFMFSMMQSLKRNSLKSIIMIHCQSTLRFKRFWIWFKENIFDSFAQSRWRRMFKHAMFVNALKFLVINFIKSWVLCLCLKCYEKKFLWTSLSACRQASAKTSYMTQFSWLLIDAQKELNVCQWSSRSTSRSWRNCFSSKSFYVSTCQQILLVIKSLYSLVFSDQRFVIMQRLNVD